MKMFFVTLIVYFLVVLIKFILSIFLSKGNYIRNSFGNGGFPSSHNAIMAALFGSSFFESGISNLTIALFFIACIILIDSVNTRGAISKNSISLNKLIKNGKHDERVGHSWLEAISGSFLGIIVTLIAYLVF